MSAPLVIALLMLCGCDQPKSSTQHESTHTSEWRENLVAFHTRNADDPKSLVLGPPASAASIAEFENAIGNTMPDEFKQLYTECDGFGTTRDGETRWFFLPVSKLPEHATEVRDRFQETHPEIAKRFIPFVDWGSEDACGYVFSETGTPLPGIFMFKHESYEFEEDQDWEEFLTPVSSSIRDVLTVLTE